uniref:Uncharacterized protein n=1 Tax=viral metagenome TaxID=1070528 RepID=A0A6C0JP50_9ZZZZ
MEYSLCDSSNDLMYSDLYDKFLELERDNINIIKLIEKQTLLLDFMITSYTTNNQIQLKLNNDIIIIFVVILFILVCLFRIIPSRK